MKISINGLHKAFDSRIKLGIMSALAVNDMLDFNSLKEFLDVTDGNLASHIKALEKDEFVGVKKIICREETQYEIFYDESRKKGIR